MWGHLQPLGLQGSGAEKSPPPSGSRWLSLPAGASGSDLLRGQVGAGAGGQFLQPPGEPGPGLGLPFSWELTVPGRGRAVTRTRQESPLVLLSSGGAQAEMAWNLILQQLGGL